MNPSRPAHDGGIGVPKHVPEGARTLNKIVHQDGSAAKGLPHPRSVSLNCSMRRHCFSVTGMTDRRGSRTKSQSFRSESALISANETGRGNSLDWPYLDDDSLGILRVGLRIRDDDHHADDGFFLAGVIEERQIAAVHFP